MAQINQNANMTNNDPYSGTVTSGASGTTPWFDWGPYLWASGDTPRSDNFFGCGGQSGLCGGFYDVREGYLLNEADYWGDYTHPNYLGLNKVANLLYRWLTNSLNSNQSFMSGWGTWAKNG